MFEETIAAISCACRQQPIRPCHADERRRGWEAGPGWIGACYKIVVKPAAAAIQRLRKITRA
jgi:hypothetical protein